METAILSKFGAEDECDGEEHFGLHVASILRSLPPKQRAYTKIEIDKLLFSAQFSEPYIPPPIPYPPPTLYTLLPLLNIPSTPSTYQPAIQPIDYRSTKTIALVEYSFLESIIIMIYHRFLKS